MQKIGLNVLSKMIEKKVTSKEIDFLIYIAQFQNEKGIIQGIYYKDICKNVHLSHQAFYNVKKSLELKGIICCEKKNYFDWDIVILDNDFSDKESFGKGYINIGHYIFTQKNFYRMKAGAKLLTMDILKINMAGGKAYEIGVNKFYKKYMELFDVTQKIIREYLHIMKLFFHVGIKDRKYFITLRKEMKKLTEYSENKKFQRHTMEIACRRNRIDVENSKKEYVETENLLNQYHWNIKEYNKFGIFDFAQVIAKSIGEINENLVYKQKWKNILKPALIHKLLRIELGIQRA